jgi:hypothetical protein
MHEKKRAAKELSYSFNAPTAAMTLSTQDSELICYNEIK